jgi:hypothetical protein
MLVPQSDSLTEIRSQLDVAFRALRSAGFVARRSFMCCSGCANSAFCGELRNLPEKARAKIKGIVFYHQQDAEALYSARRRRFAYPRRDSLTIRFGATPETDSPAMTTFEVGVAVLLALRDAGLKATWSGKTNACIVVPVREG